MCYSKGVGYKPGKIYNRYPIDSTWGSGHIEDMHFVRQRNEFYFCCDPELLIRTHFPSDEKWM